MAPETKRYLDKAVLIRLLNVSQHRLQRWHHEGGGPTFIRASAQRVLYDMGALDGAKAGAQ